MFKRLRDAIVELRVLLKDLKDQLELLSGKPVCPGLDFRYARETADDLGRQLDELASLVLLSMGTEVVSKRERAVSKLLGVVNLYRLRDSDGMSKGYDWPLRVSDRDKIIAAALDLALAYDESEPTPAPIPQPESVQGPVLKTGPHPPDLKTPPLVPDEPDVFERLAYQAVGVKIKS